jgi:hypothetical protein
LLEIFISPMIDLAFFFPANVKATREKKVIQRSNVIAKADQLTWRQI